MATDVSSQKVTVVSPASPTGEPQCESITNATTKNLADFKESLREEFREKQKLKREIRIQKLLLGKGFGSTAEESVETGYYMPTKVLEELNEADKAVWAAMDNIPEDKEPSLSSSYCSTISSSRSRISLSSCSKGPGSRVCSTDPLAQVKGKSRHSEAKRDKKNRNNDSLSDDDQPIPVIEKFRCAYKPIHVLYDVRMEVAENIRTAENELEAACSPFTFDEVLETLDTALIAIERGSLKEKVSLPMLVRSPPSHDPKKREAQRKEEKENPLYLVGSVEVLEFIRTFTFPVVYEIVPTVHSIQWVMEYTIVFLKSIAAQNEEEAQIRVNLLASCVRLIGQVEKIVSIMLSLESKAEEYDVFFDLKQCSEEYIFSIITNVTSSLDRILALEFPYRREQLLRIEPEMELSLQRALLFLNELDYSWVPTVQFQQKWKEELLSKVFRLIHVDICSSYIKASMGYLDSRLYEMVQDRRFSPSSTTERPVARKVPQALMVAHERVEAKESFPVIGAALKGSGSRLVGLQLCMGARYVLCQAVPEFDEAWGFPMDEPPVIEKDEAETENMVSEFMLRLRGERKERENRASLSGENH